MLADFDAQLAATLTAIRKAGLYKTERVLTGPQGAEVSVAGEAADGRTVLNFCANNYLGLADHPEIIAAAKAALDRYGFGLSSVRFICGTQTIHQELEQSLSAFLGTEDTILYPSCFDANGGLFETILGPEDAVVSDELNHASIIDGIRLCKAQRYRYRHANLDDLAAQLCAADAKGARHKLIATDGVFSMDGTVADLAGICALADRHGATVMFDDCHATGFLGRTGRGTHEHAGVHGRPGLITTGTLGKALGGASGGYTSGPKKVVELLRQRSRPYLFSNSVAPCVVAASLKALEIASRSTALRDRLEANTRHFRAGLEATGLTVRPGATPIVPVMLGEAELAQRFAARMLEKGVYVVGFFYPVVPQGQARIRTQVSAAHTPENLDTAIRAFAEVKQELGI